MLVNSPDREVDQIHLTDLIQRALDRPTLQVTNWKAQTLHTGLGRDSAVFRFQGKAEDGQAHENACSLCSH